MLQITEAAVYWDDLDSQEPGWAYRIERAGPVHDSGAMFDADKHDDPKLILDDLLDSYGIEKEAGEIESNDAPPAYAVWRRK